MRSLPPPDLPWGHQTTILSTSGQPTVASLGETHSSISVTTTASLVPKGCFDCTMWEVFEDSSSDLDEHMLFQTM
jgi:hypothetical protein